MQNVVDNSKATLRVHWSQAPTAPPELFGRESFASTSPLPWTTPVAPVATPTPR